MLAKDKIISRAYTMMSLLLSKDSSTSQSIYIRKKYFCPGRMAPPEWMRSVRAVSDTPVAEYFAPGLNTTRRIAYRPAIAVSPFLLALSVS
jgi:hypothetical protein